MWLSQTLYRIPPGLRTKSYLPTNCPMPLMSPQSDAASALKS